MPRLASNSIDLILTDPPYGARYVSRDGRRILNDDDLSGCPQPSRRYTACYARTAAASASTGGTALIASWRLGARQGSALSATSCFRRPTRPAAACSRTITNKRSCSRRETPPDRLHPSPTSFSGDTAAT